MFALRFLFLPLLLIAAAALFAGGPGFRTQELLDAHYAKHGAEFGNITKQDYLTRAQELRDAPVGGPILEAKRPNAVFSRFDKRKGYFGAYDPDGIIRTLFIPV